MLRKRPSTSITLLACTVVKTRWPVSAAAIAMSAVSASRISPTMILSGSWRRIERSPRAKVRPFFSFTGIWVMPAQLVLDRVLDGDDLVLLGLDLGQRRRRASWSCPSPVGPVTSTMPYGSRMKRRKRASSFSSKPSTSRRSEANCLERLSLSRMRMTASSPCTDGMIETRKSTLRPLMRTRKRPSCGTRFSAMSSSAMTLMRLMMVEWCSLAIGFMADWSTPSMRYLITTSLSRVSMWMSEARRLSASKTAESTRRMMGDASAWILSIERTSSPFSSSCRTWILNDSDACSSTRCVPWPRFSASWIAEGVPTAGWIGVRRSRPRARPPPGCRWGRPSPAPAGPPSRR